MTATTARIRATIRLLTPDHITPQGVRQLERALDDEEAKVPTGATVEALDAASQPLRDTPLEDGEHSYGEVTR
ncbi:hypothetical protein [Rathayibacter sp. PhB127]|uniref:hypothetical protein n=1 Tax=Rathayibacter sp. PhB127 TaxID=2485176 RepID=UPI0011CDDB69|nr:hypothetical protein [Rathayibacter sp. PhB127]